jgi:circadian clock protein KaiC
LGEEPTYGEGRLRSGHHRLDCILAGGLHVNSLTLITGAPGSGKTLLAQQFVFANATEESPALYISTVSEPLDRIMRYGRTLSFFDETAVGRTVHYEDFGALLNERGLPGVVDRLGDRIDDLGPGLIVIDSFKALHAFARTPEDFRWFLHDLAGRLGASPATSLWVGEYSREDIAHEPEFAVADAILSLSAVQTAERETRVLQVLKLRGSSFLSGQHTYRLSADGFDVFPRLADTGVEEAYDLSGMRISSGIKGLDEMLGEGFWAGASTLVAGPSGAGKTVMGLHFLFNGAHQGERVLMAALQENPSQLERTARGFGWSMSDPNVELMYRSSVDLYIDEWVHHLLERADEVNARRIVIDSLGDLAFTASDEIRFREYVYSLVQRCSRRGVSVLMTLEVADLFHISRLSDSSTSHLSDNVLLLQFLRGRSRVQRALTVLKTRASLHEPVIRQFSITSDGIVLGDEFELAQDLE